MKKKFLVILLLSVFDLCSTLSVMYAGDDSHTLSNAKVIQDKGYRDNLLIDCTGDGAIVTHLYKNNAQYTKNVEIYVQYGNTATYCRDYDKNIKWWIHESNDIQEYHVLYTSSGEGSRHDLVAGEAQEVKRKYLVYSTNEKVLEHPVADLHYAKIDVQVGATSVAHDSPVNLNFYIKRFCFDFTYYANGAQFGDVDHRWSLYSTNTLNVGPGTNPSKEGYTFLGWNTSGETLSNQGTIISTIELTNPDCWVTNEDLQKDRVVKKNFYSQWEATPYTITYNANGGSCPIATETYTIESATRNTPTPTRWGYDFKGWKVTTAEKNWTLNDVYGVDIKQLAQGLYGNVTLEAQWQIKTFPVKTTFTSGKGTASTDQNITFGQNSTAVTIDAAKNYRIKTVKVVMSVDGTDIVKVDESYDPAVNPVSSYTVSAMKIEGETNITVTTERVSADVTLSKPNLQGNDCSIIEIKNDTRTYSVILTPSVPSVTLNEVPLGTYSLTETGWSYTYDKASALPASFTIANSDTEDKTFTFDGAKKTSDRFSAEKHKSN